MFIYLFHLIERYVVIIKMRRMWFYIFADTTIYSSQTFTMVWMMTTLYVKRYFLKSSFMKKNYWSRCYIKINMFLWDQDIKPDSIKTISGVKQYLMESLYQDVCLWDQDIMPNSIKTTPDEKIILCRVLDDPFSINIWWWCLSNKLYKASSLRRS